jgi:hypothetical protein
MWVSIILLFGLRYIVNCKNGKAKMCDTPLVFHLCKMHSLIYIYIYIYIGFFLDTLLKHLFLGICVGGGIKWWCKERRGFCSYNLSKYKVLLQIWISLVNFYCKKCCKCLAWTIMMHTLSTPWYLESERERERESIDWVDKERWQAPSPD